MSPRSKKLIGSFGVMVFLGTYIWLASLIADHVPRLAAAQLAFYVVAGMLWGVPLLPLIRWMNREPASRSTSEAGR